MFLNNVQHYTFHLKPTQLSEKKRVSKVPVQLQEKVHRLLDILEQYETISPVNKEQQPKENTFLCPVIILAKGESIKIVLDAGYLKSLIDQLKRYWPIEPIQVLLTIGKEHFYTTADINSAYNQMPVVEQSR